MISFDEASALIAAAARPLGTERIALAAAAGRVLAEPVTAGFESPAADLSVMDGYAVRGADLPGRLRVVGEAFPSAEGVRAVGAGEALRVFTGAPLPGGADRVVIQEVARREGEFVVVGQAANGPAFVRRRGSDFAPGTVLLEAGRRLTPRALVAAAAADQGEVTVYRAPRVAVLGTGDELVPPGQARGRAGAIPDSITLAVAALAAEAGGQLVLRDLAPDDPERIRAAAERALGDADMVVVTGGASVGEKDLGPAVFADLGLEPVFRTVAMKPGKPIWFGRVGERLVLGLPGNPTSALVTARLFLVPLLAELGGGEGAATLRWRSGSLAGALPATGERETFVRARADGEIVVPFANQESGSQRVIADADLLIRRPIGAPAAPAGAAVPVLDL